MVPQIHTYSGVALAACRGVVILLWTGDPTLAANRWTMKHITRERDAIRGEAVVLQIVATTAGTPGPDARRYVQDAYRRELSPTQRIVTVALGDSWRHALIRAIARGMAIIAGKSDFITVVSTLEEGFEAAARGRAGPSVGELESCVNAMLRAAG